MKVVIKHLEYDEKIMHEVKKFLFTRFQDEFGYGYVPEWHQDIMNLDEYYIEPERNNFFIAFNEKNEIIATIGVRAYDKNFKEFEGRYSKETASSIWRLFVDKKYRRCGLASKMFSIAENFAFEADYDYIYLHTHKTYDGALEFWTKMGFVEFLDAHDELQTVHMDKKLYGVKIASQASSFSYALEF